MVRLDLRLDGLPALRGRLRPDASDRAIDRVLQEAALEIQARATLRAPVDTNRLRGSLTVQRVGPLSHAVVAATHYAPYVELGTGQRGRASSQPGGVPPEYQHGPSLGQPSQPYLRPALLEVRELLERPETWKDLL